MVGTTYVEVACHTDIGRLRDHNEDAVLACVVDGCGRIADLNAVVAVADGDPRNQSSAGFATLRLITRDPT
jgi:serine/threonine protein phosphatase PrpC